MALTEICGLNTKVKVAGNWEAPHDIHVKLAGTWTKVKRGYSKVSGTWEQTYNRLRTIQFTKAGTPVTTGPWRVYAAASVVEGYGLYTDIDLATYLEDIIRKKAKKNNKEII